MFRSLSLGVSVALAVAVAEAAARVLQVAEPHYPMAPMANVLYHEDPNGLVELTPNWEGYISFHWTRINAKGFRDRIFASEPASDTIRVVVLGDSYTMGDGVPVEQTYPKVLEERLGREMKIEVMNCAISATNSSNQLETLRQVIRNYHPDVVVLGHNLNDFRYPAETRFEAAKRNGFSFVVGSDRRVTLTARLTAFQRVKMYVREHSYLWRAVIETRRLRELKQHAPDEYEPRSRIDKWIRAGGALKSFQAVDEMRRLSAEHGIEFLSFVLPDLTGVPPSLVRMGGYPYKDVHAMIVEQLRARGVTCIDLLPAFGDHRLDDLGVHRFDRHFNKFGHELVAEAMIPHLRRAAAGARRRLAGRVFARHPDDRQSSTRVTW